MSRQFLTLQQKIACLDVIRANVIEVPGGCRYKNGLDDDGLAKLCGEPVNKHHIKNIRQAVFGILVPRKTIEPDVDSLTRAVYLIGDHLNRILAELGRTPVDWFGSESSDAE
jgi:hypothetical protein